MDLFVIRHTSVHQAKGLCYGQLEVELEVTHEKEIQLIRDKLSEPFDVVYTSPLKRCTILAEQLPGAEILSDERLLEINFGQWEGQLWQDLTDPHVEAWMSDFVKVQPPGGESLETVYRRVSDFLEEIRLKSHRRIAVVTHAGVMRCVWAHLVGIPLANIFKVKVDYGQIDQFTLQENSALDQWITRIL